MELPSGLGDVLSSLMANPEVMKAVSSIALETAKGDDGQKSAPAPSQDDEPKAALPAFTGESHSSNNSKDDRRRALLSALKPYLSPKRCAVIDSLLQFEGLAHVLGVFDPKEIS